MNVKPRLEGHVADSRCSDQVVRQLHTAAGIDRNATSYEVGRCNLYALG